MEANKIMVNIIQSIWSKAVLKISVSFVQLEQPIGSMSG